MDNPLQENAIATLWDIAGGAAEVVHELIDDYVTMAKQVMSQIDRALTANDPRGAEHAAHSLKGSSSMMGAHLVQRASEVIERAAAEGDLARARAHFPELQTAHEATLERLRKVREQPGPSV